MIHITWTLLYGQESAQHEELAGFDIWKWFQHGSNMIFAIFSENETQMWKGKQFQS